MTLRILRFPGLFLLLIAIITFPLVSTASAERDPLASVVGMDSPQLQALPTDIFTENQSEAINGVVNEARQFGIPLVVRVISMPTSMEVLADASAITGAAPTGQQVVQRMADEWLVDEGVETSEGAGDGFLLLVAVPEDDHTQSIAAFATGPNALPLNGLSQENLDGVLNNVIYPFFKENRIAAGIHSGIAYLSYDNLFAVPARHELSHQQETLQNITNVGISGLTILAVIALGGLIFWIQRRDHQADIADRTIRSPFVAGALARGRVDGAAVTGAILYLLNLGAISSSKNHSGELVLRIEGDMPIADPFAQRVMDRLKTEAGDNRIVHDASIRRIQDVLIPAREWLQDDLASRHLFNRDARVETVWIGLGSVVVAAMALFSLMPSMMSMSRLGIAAIVVSIVAFVLALIWVARRSWATRAGKQALIAWRSGAHDPDEIAIFDAIVHQDVLLETPGGPDVPVSVQTMRGLRALGAG